MFRKMRRFKQEMSAEETELILAQQKRGVLALSGDGGYPYAVPMNYVYDCGRIYFHSALEGHKIDAVKACDKCSFNVLRERELSDDGWSYFVDSVTVFGRISEVKDEDKKTEKLRALGMKYFPTARMVESDIAKNAARCTMLELIPEHISGKRVHER